MFGFIKEVSVTVGKSLLRFKGRTSAFLLTTGLGVAINIATPYFFIQAFLSFELYEYLILMLIGSYGAAWSAGQFLPIIREKLISPISTNMADHLAYKIAKQFYKLPLDYQLSNPTGEVSLLMTKCHYSILNLIPSLLGKIIPVILEVVGTTILLTIAYGPVGLMQSGMLILATGTSVIGSRLISNSKKESLTKGFQYGATYHAAFANYENAHFFGNTSLELTKVKEQAAAFSKKLNRTDALIQNFSILQVVILGLNITGIMIVTGLGLANHTLPLEGIIAINIYSLQFALSINKFTGSINDLIDSGTDLQKINSFIKSGLELREIKEAADLDLNNRNASITFRNVTFSYKNKVILDNISFSVAPGNKTAIVGLSGEGKSTILKLLFRFYDVDSGKILINGQDIKEVTLESLRKSIAVVPQNPNLFNSTILENIGYGNTSATPDQIKFAAACAGLSEFVEQQPDNYDTVVGENGNKLSGGQKQRLALARAVLKKANIYFLDEPTSSLDIKTEKEVQTNLDLICSNTTTLLITHRWTTIMNADNIIYLENGKIAEQGNYQDLIKLEGKFYQQMSEYCKELGINIEDVRAPESQKTEFSPRVQFAFEQLRQLKTPKGSVREDLFYENKHEKQKDSLRRPILLSSFGPSDD